MRRHQLLGAVGALLLLAVIALAGKAVVAALPPRAAAQQTPTQTAEATASAEPTIAQPATTTPKPSGPATITVAAVGDMIFDRQVAALIEATDSEEPLKDVASQLAAADIAVGNLESPLSARGTPDTEKSVTFRGDPAGAEGLALAGFDFLSLANWGVEYQDNCNGDQVEDAHRAVDAGADMVLSHHPHVIQAVEYYDGALIAYSLGDFVFDHYSRKTGEAFILEADLGPYGVSGATATPVYLNEYGKPEYVTGDAAATILSRLQTISAPRGTTVEITGDTTRILP